MDSADIALERQTRARGLAVAHSMASDKAEAMHMWLGVPVVILTIVVGTAAFSTLTDIGKSLPIIAVVAGLLSVTAAVLAGLQTFLDFAGRAEAHAKAAAKLNGIVDEVDHTLSKQEFKTLIDVDKRLSLVIQESPRVSIALQEAARDYIKKHNQNVDVAPPRSAITEAVAEKKKATEQPGDAGSGSGGGGGGGGRLWHPMDKVNT
jgi:hypothetical protein